MAPLAGKRLYSLSDWRGKGLVRGRTNVMEDIYSHSSEASAEMRCAGRGGVLSPSPCVCVSLSLSLSLNVSLRLSTSLYLFGRDRAGESQI